MLLSPALTTPLCVPLYFIHIKGVKEKVIGVYKVDIRNYVCIGTSSDYIFSNMSLSFFFFINQNLEQSPVCPTEYFHNYKQEQQ